MNDELNTILDSLEDEAMDAECRVLGTIMLLGSEATGTPLPLLVTLLGFQSPFHRVVYCEVMRRLALGLVPDPVSVWEGVEQHEDASDFGLQHLAELVSEAANPATFQKDVAAVMAWGSLKAMEQTRLLPAGSTAKH